MKRTARAAILAATMAATWLPALTTDPPPARAGVLFLKSCSGFNNGANDTEVGGSVWQGMGAGGYGFPNRCSQQGSLQIVATKNAAKGDNGQWHTIAPPSIGIIAAYTPPNDALINPSFYNLGWKGDYFWNGGSQQLADSGNCCGGMDYAVGINRSDLGGSRYFGWQVTCYASPCDAPLGELVDVHAIDLEGVDNAPPSLQAVGANSVWNQGGHYVRGVWPASFQANDDSGICGMYQVVDSETISGPVDSRPNQGSWTQCPSPLTMSETLDTSLYPDGPLTLKLGAWDAANPPNRALPSETLDVDNQPVSLALTGPTDAPSTEGTQYIDATASAGPSGVAGIACSLDGSPYQFHAGARVQMAVQGVGLHRASCYGENNAVNVGGARATSPVTTWTLGIRQPSVSTVSFARVVDALRCARRRERVRIPARWVTGKYHGHPVRIKLPAESRTVTVVHCHPRIVRRRVRVHGRWHTQRVVLLPHTVRDTAKRIRHGAATSISGWIGTTQGNALGRQRVRILTAADNGHGVFRQAAVTTTAPDGSWSARLAPGPSRVVQALYGGTTTVEPSSSAPARIVVPALLRVSASPTHTHWGDSIAISGRLRGGYVPPAGELVVLWIGWPGGSTEIGHLYARRDGRFRSTYTFLRGNGTETYRLWAATATESDYPYAAGSSPKTTVRVGP